VARSAKTRDEIVREQVRIGFLAALPERAVETLLAEGIRMDVPAGSLIYRSDESPRVFVVVEGLTRTFLTTRARATLPGSRSCSADRHRRASRR
jgi:hypothetical protein